MPVTVTCACGKRLKAPDALAGKRAKCPACGTQVDIPKVGEPASTGGYVLAPEESVKCPECGQEMKANARECSRCAAMEQQRAQASARATEECPICGGEVEEGEDCPTCKQATKALRTSRKQPQKVSKATPESVETVRETSPCPACGFAMRLGALVCLDCGHRVEPPIQVNCKCGHYWEVDRSLAGKSVLCPACKGKTAVAARACSICGTPLEEGDDCPICQKAQQQQVVEVKSSSLTCPKCGTENVQKTSIASKAASFAIRHGALGFFGKILAPATPSKTYHCKSCGAEW